jgi:hypothetical protein
VTVSGPGFFLKLTMVAREQPANGEILIKVGPMQTEGRNFDVI